MRCGLIIFKILIFLVIPQQYLNNCLEIALMFYIHPYVFVCAQYSELNLDWSCQISPSNENKGEKPYMTLLSAKVSKIVRVGRVRRRERKEEREKKWRREREWEWECLCIYMSTCSQESCAVILWANNYTGVNFMWCFDIEISLYCAFCQYLNIIELFTHTWS